jgi:hypothetical protein
MDTTVVRVATRWVRGRRRPSSAVSIPRFATPGNQAEGLDRVDDTGIPNTNRDNDLGSETGQHPLGNL